GVAPRFVELFRDDVADPEAVDTLADRDPGFRVDVAGLLDPAAYVGLLARGAGQASVWAQVLDQLPAPTIAVPIRGTVSAQRQERSQCLRRPARTGRAQPPT